MRIFILPLVLAVAVPLCLVAGSTDYPDLVGINDSVALAVGATSGPTCGVGDNGFTEIIPISGAPPFSYLWSTGDTTAQLDGLTAGDYIVTVTDANDCATVSNTISLISSDPLILTCPDNITLVNVPGATGVLLGPELPDPGNCNLDSLVYELTGAVMQPPQAGLPGELLFPPGITTINYVVPGQSSCSFDIRVLESGITCNRELDSLLLVDFYHATAGENWINSWDLSAPLDTWYGVSLNGNECVSCLDLDGLPDCAESLLANGNNVHGEIPANFGGLIALEGFFLTDNFIEGAIPESFTSLSLLESLLLDNNRLMEPVPAGLATLPALNLVLLDFNRLTFEDLLPIVDYLTTISYDYSPQNPFYPDTLITQATGTALTINLGIDGGIVNNVYRWEKDGEFYQENIGDNTLDFASLTLADAGVYTVCVTNPDAPDLTLCSENITLSVLDNAPVFLSLPAINTEVGSEFCVPLTVTGLTGVDAFNFAILFDESALSFVGAQNFAEAILGFGEDDLFVSTGRIDIGWFIEPIAVTVAPGDTLVELCFEALVCGENQLTLATDPVPAFVRQADDVALPVEFEPDGPLVIASNLEVVLNTMNPTCGQNDGAVSVAQVLNGSGNYTYLWNNQSTEPGLTGLPPGDSYNLSLTDEASGCMAMANSDVLVNEGASVSTNLSEAICAGDEYLFNGEVLTASGVYFDTLTTANVQCDSVVILDLSVLPIPNAEIAGDTTFCPGDGPQILSVVEVAGYQYLWSTEEQENSILVDGSLASVAITVTATNGCTATDSVMILADELPVVTITGSLTSCGGTSTEVTASGGVFYTWSSGATTPTAVLPVGQHAVETTSLAGCTATTIVEVIAEEAPLLPNYAPELIGCGNGLDTLEIMVEGDLTVDWFAADTSLLSEGVTTFIPPASGEYLAQVRDLTTTCVSTQLAVFGYSATDIEPPVIAGCPSDISVILNRAEETEVVVDWVEPTATDNCALQSFSSNLEPGVALVADAIVVYTAVDDAGLEAVCSFEVTVNPTDDLVLYLDTFKITVDDSLARVPIFANQFEQVEGLQSSLTLVDTAGSVIIGLDSIWPTLADDFSFQIEPSQAGLRFLWADLDGSPPGLSLPDSTPIFHLLVELGGDYGSCTDLLFVDDPLERSAFRTPVGEVVPSTKGGVVCRPALATIAGLILREDDDPIAQVRVDCQTPDTTFVTFTDETGYYEFSRMQIGQAYELIPFRDDNHRNGISLTDLTTIQRYILGEAERLPTPYRIIAADVTNNRVVSLTDLTTLSRILLNDFVVFPSNQSWRFVDADFLFPDETYPWLTSFPETRQVVELRGDNLQNNFIGIKIGDVNLSANPSN